MPCAGDIEGLAGVDQKDEAEGGGRSKTGSQEPSLTSLYTHPPCTVAHLFRAPTMDGAEGSPLEGLEKLSRGSLPQRGSRVGSGGGGDRPWKLRARGRGAAPGGLW